MLKVIKTKEDIAEVLKEEEKNGRPVNIAIDCLAGEKLGECLKYVARGCRWIQIASLAGDMSSVDFRNIFVKNILQFSFSYSFLTLNGI